MTLRNIMSNEKKSQKRRMHSDFISIHLKQALISGD